MPAIFDYAYTRLLPVSLSCHLSVHSPTRPDSVHSDFGALKIIYLLTYLLTYFFHSILQADNLLIVLIEHNNIGLNTGMSYILVHRGGSITDSRRSLGLVVVYTAKIATL